MTSLKQCDECSETFEIQKSQPNKRFCSQSCAAKFNNRKRRKRQKNCEHCSKPLIRHQAKFCSPECFQEDRWRQAKESGDLSPPQLRRFCREKFGDVCQSCFNSEWMGKTIPLEVEHIDGNSDNNSEKNLSWLCPNCHALTPTYKAKNKGNGRAARRERYHQGKSY